LTALAGTNAPSYLYATPAPAAVEAPADETPADPAAKTVDWWVIPSAAFAIAVLLAVVLWAIRKLMERRAKVYRAKETSYDRAATLENIHNRNARNLAAVESFDDENAAGADGSEAGVDAAPETDAAAPVEEKPAPAEDKAPADDDTPTD
ncbi:MAG: hypothetical protein LBM78_04890, partial [Clostridiales bacterium]|nr:hypothetical protein [Clostridiales bacterium]